MERLYSDVWSTSARRDRLPDSLSEFLHACTPLPCPVFLTTCPPSSVYTAWHDIVEVLLDPRRHPARHGAHLTRLRHQLDATEVPAALEPGVHPICDPDRTRYLFELLDGTFVNRLHLQALLRRERDPVAIAQTTYLTDMILAQFPPTGLATTSVQALLAQVVSASPDATVTSR